MIAKDVPNMRILIVEDEIRLAEALGQIMAENKWTIPEKTDSEKKTHLM